MGNKVQPIKPNEVTKTKKNSVPDEVLEAFNEMITSNFSGGEATFRQDEVIGLIMVKMDLAPERRDQIFDEHWLDVEDIYRAEGWKVEYDSPGYCESYPATFTFTRRRRAR